MTKFTEENWKEEARRRVAKRIEIGEITPDIRLDEFGQIIPPIVHFSEDGKNLCNQDTKYASHYSLDWKEVTCQNCLNRGKKLKKTQWLN